MYAVCGVLSVAALCNLAITPVDKRFWLENRGKAGAPTER